MVWDQVLTVFLNRTIAGPLVDWLMVAITLATTPPPLVFGCLVVLVRKKWEGLAFLSTICLSTLLAVGLQLLLQRPRPADVRLIFPTPDFPSFPSGHAAAAFGCATLVTLFWPRAGLPSALGALLVSLSRVYLGHHYPSDVLGGAILGVAAGLVVYGSFYRPLRLGQGPFRPGRRPARGQSQHNSDARPAWAWLLWAQLAVVLLAILGTYLDLLRLGILTVPGVDKLLHLLLFGGLAFFAVAWWARRPAGLVLVILGLLALLEEGLQALSRTRSLDWLDLVATLLGVVLFGWAARRALRLNRAPRRRG